jgi:iron(III) transport system substrate-binding protein
MIRPILALASLALALAASVGIAGARPARQVVVYTALDRQFSEPLLRRFESESGIRVLPVYDTEAVKTVGLVNRLLAERARPRADVFWNNEILRSIQLKEEGLTEAYDSPSAIDIPPAMRDPDRHWTGFAARARVAMVNTRLVPDRAVWPTRWEDLADPRWKGRATFAKPLFGTTNTQAAVHWAMAGPADFAASWLATFDNAVMLAGNAQARDAVAAGEAAWCFTDTDDAVGAILDGAPVRMIYADTIPGQSGVLLLPNTVVLIKGGPNPAEGRALIDYLLSRPVEQELSLARGAQIPVRPGIPLHPSLPDLPTSRVLTVDWSAAYRAIAPANAWLQSEVAKR